MFRRGPGLIRGVARTAAVVGTASAVAGGVQHRQQRRWGQQEDQSTQAAPVETAAPVPTSTSTDDQISELQKLAELKDQGILTEDEFTAKKKQILGL